MEIAFSYSRKSPDEKEETERSLKNQDDLMKTISLGKGWKLKQSFSDKNISGSDRERKGLKECLTIAKKHKVSNPQDKVYIIVKDQYRFSRDSAFFQDTLRDLDAYGVKVYSVVKNDFLSHEDLGDNVLSLVSQEAIKKGKRDALMLQEKKIQKGLPCTPCPFGYKYDYRKSWSPRKKESQIVKGVVENYLNSVDYKVTVEDFNINRPKYYRIIKNAEKGLYSGYSYYVRKYKDSRGEIVRTEEIKYRIKVEKIISEEIYLKLKEEVKLRNPKIEVTNEYVPYAA